jgi:hypothetical protein
MKNHKIVGGGPGAGKVFIPPLTSKEWKKLQESLESTSAPKTVRWTRDPPSINRPPEDDDRAEKSDVERLLRVVSTLRNNNRALEE